MDWIRKEDLDHALGQIRQSDLFERWPGLAWEQHLEWHSREFLTFMMGEIVATCTQVLPNEPIGSRRSAMLTRVIRKVLTLVYASVYCRMGNRLPHMSEEKARREINKHSAFVRSKFFKDDEVVARLGALNPLLAESFVKMTDGTIPYGSARFVICTFTKALLNEANEQGVLDLPETDPDDTFKRWMNGTRRFNMPEPGEKGKEPDLSPTDPAFWRGDNGGLMLALPPHRDPEKVTFSSVGGQPKAKKELKKLSSALKNPERYKRWGTRPVRGVLLTGPPGTGKTRLAQALANETDAEFIPLNCQDIFTKWYGESENNVEKLFTRAREAKNGAIIFMDEADSFIQDRDSTDNVHEVTQRIIGAFNRQMDGFKPSDRVVVIFATNHHEHIDAAVKRAGRIDRIIEVSLPDQEGREEIFRIHMERAEMIAERPLFASVDVPMIAARLEGFNGADIAEILRRTLENKIAAEDEGKHPESVATEDIGHEIDLYERKPGDSDNKKLKKIGKIGF